MRAPLIRCRAHAIADDLPAGMHPVLRRVYAGRGIKASQLALDLQHLLPPASLLGIDAAAALIADAILAGQRFVVAGDYDADGATGTALAVLGLRALGARAVHYVVPDRFLMGYGLSPALAERAATTGAGLLVTVDNGIASLAGVQRAQALGLTVVITDHHLAGPQLPAAAAIVNPNQPGCAFASKALAGVGVMFYVLGAVRSALRARGAFAARPEPNLAQFLDLVALGTIADVVPLDYNNRILVEQGLRRIRAGHCRPGIRALLALCGREPARVTSGDLGFLLGPRINAAGRLDDIRTGIECLLADDAAQAQALAGVLDRFNRERRGIEARMREDAEQFVADSTATGVVLFDSGWHEGVVGLVASRIKEQLHRPVIAFARAQEAGMLKGSGRSIEGLHLRDALALVDARQGGVIQRFGGHAMAAGLTIEERHLGAFEAAFDAVCAERLDETALHRVLETDGELAGGELVLDTARVLETAGPWGQGFAEPLFDGVFDVAEARLIGSNQAHVKYRLRRDGAPALAAVDFNGAQRLCARGSVRLLYRATVNRYQGTESLDLRIEHLEAGSAQAV